MENATEALYIAAGTLLGVMIISIVVFFFRRVGSLQEQQDRIMTADQLAEWNNMYLAYNKKIMYGTDLISVLNKAQSNNEKYVNGKGFLTGYRYTNSYLIDIEFTLNSPLQDTITFYYFDDLNKKQEFAYSTGDGPDNVDNEKISTLFSAYNITSYNGSDSINTEIDLNSTNLKTQVADSIFGVSPTSTYKLLEGDHTDSTVKKLLGLANNMKMDVTNDGDNISQEVIVSPSGVTQTRKGWSHVSWVTCLSDLKSRKFSCTGVEYDTSSEQTGRIVKMTFEELKHK